jgi:hypothetical protein
VPPPTQTKETREENQPLNSSMADKGASAGTVRDQ